MASYSQSKKDAWFLKNESEESKSGVMKAANDKAGDKTPGVANGSAGDKSEKEEPAANGSLDAKPETDKASDSTNGDIEKKAENGNVAALNGTEESTEEKTTNECFDNSKTNGISEHNNIDAENDGTEKQTESTETKTINEVSEKKPQDSKVANGDTGEKTVSTEKDTSNENSENKTIITEVGTGNGASEKKPEKSDSNTADTKLENYAPNFADKDTSKGKAGNKSIDVSSLSRKSDDTLLAAKKVEKSNTAVGKVGALHKMPNTGGSDDQQSSKHEKPDDQLNIFIKHKDDKHLKRWLRSHHWSTNHPIRGNLWLKTCKYLHRFESDIYDEIVQDLFRDGPPETLGLPQFVDQSHLHHYYLTQTGIHTVHIILVVLENLNPDITFSPTLFPLTALFLHFMKPQECFNCLYAMLRCKDNRYLAQTKVAVDASRLVMRDLTKHHAKSAYGLITRNSEGSVDSVFENWVWWVLRDLPFPFLIHIVDCFLYEGVKVFYRMALAVLILYNKHSGGKSQQQNTNTKAGIRHFCEEMPFKVEKLFKTAFGIRGLGKKEMQKLQVRHEMFTKSQTVRMTRAQSVARSTSRSSFSGVPASHSTRSFSIPAPLVLKSRRKNELVSQDLLLTVWAWLPARYTICQPQLLYTSEEHGISLRTLYSRAQHHEPTLLIVKTTTNEIFGAFCSTDWNQRTMSKKNLSYFGTGESFVFSLLPAKVAYEWVGLYKSDVPATGSMFMAGDNHVLIIGGGNGVAIQLDEGFAHCRSESCDTFDNPPLCSTEDFACKVVEVFGFK